MTTSRTRTPASTAISAAVLLGLTALGATGCGDDHHAAEARRALGTQLGSLPPGARRGPGAQAASADDLATARRYLETTLRLDPNNPAARAALAGLGPNPDVDAALLDVARMPGPVASRAEPGRVASSLSRVAFGDVGALGADVADAVSPWTRVTAVTSPAPRTAADSAEALAAFVGARSAAADSAARDSSVRHARFQARARVVTVRRRVTRRAEVALAAREDSVSQADSVLVAASETAEAPPRKHKRTWPWTRAQRWLVAKGIGGGAGAGVVLGAIVGNIPGALIAGSLGGGAVGFKKATQVGPAAPFPSARDSATFDAEKRERDRKAKADTTNRVAARP